MNMVLGFFIASYLIEMKYMISNYPVYPATNGFADKATKGV